MMSISENGPIPSHAIVNYQNPVEVDMTIEADYDSL